MFEPVKKWMKAEPIAFVIYSIALTLIGAALGAIAF